MTYRTGAASGILMGVSGLLASPVNGHASGERDALLDLLTLEHLRNRSASTQATDLQPHVWDVHAMHRTVYKRCG